MTQKAIPRENITQSDFPEPEDYFRVFEGKPAISPRNKTEKYTHFNQFPGYQVLQKRKVEAQQNNISVPFFLTSESINNDRININDSEYINFSGYNYLGLSGYKYVSDAAKAAIDKYGTSVSASRIVSGQIPLHLELERVISNFLGVDDCIVFVSGYCTNVTTIGHLFGRKDLVIHDNLAHNSIQTGCQLTKAQRLIFPHNNWDKLEELLDIHREEYQRVLIILEGAYSMDGNIPDIRRAIDIKRRYNALLMIDEAHSLGVIGETGGGVGEYFSIDRKNVDIWMGSLSKTFASCGGFIAGNQALIEYMKFSTPGFIFSVGLSPPDAAAALAAFEIIQREPERVKRLHKNTLLFLELAKQHGLDTGLNSGTPIVPIVIGNAISCMQLSQRLFDLGIHVQPIIYPAVMQNDARLRFFITSMHTEDQIRYTVSMLAQELAKLEKR
ncbi:MAG: aminotransferase class I/II-fold pyridoxal phosphate-dependent enzyme [Gammaproteobacteria bacterium]|nr:aminotransferase class I/II-fold pyridoxal phosphate-dependent enzyme [Gammaproteobacteria bacterium]